MEDEIREVVSPGLEAPELVIQAQAEGRQGPEVACPAGRLMSPVVLLEGRLPRNLALYHGVVPQDFQVVKGEATADKSTTPCQAGQEQQSDQGALGHGLSIARLRPRGALHWRP